MLAWRAKRSMRRAISLGCMGEPAGAGEHIERLTAVVLAPFQGRRQNALALLFQYFHQSEGDGNGPTEASVLGTSRTRTSPLASRTLRKMLILAASRSMASL